MDTNNEILDAIEILAGKKISENITKVLTGICKFVNINNNTCVMDSNGVSSTVQFYGSPPDVNELYRIFVPSNDMSRSFIIVPPRFTVNPNLLDNWYFANPVNQRGQTEYTAAGYTVDRWSIGAGSNGTLQLNESGLKITRTDGIMYLTHRISKTQIPEESTLTYSVLTTSGLFFTSFVVKNDIYHEQVVGGGISLGWNYTPAEMVEFTLVNNTVNSDVIVLAAKLELGPTQTLAHQENGVWVLNEVPNYGEQLRRCQRYAIKIGKDTAGDSSLVGFALCTSSTLASAFISLPVSMRTKPIVSFKNVYLSLGNSVVAVTNITMYENTQNGIYCALSVSGGLTVGQTVAIRTSDGGYIMPSADL